MFVAVIQYCRSVMGVQSVSTELSAELSAIEILSVLFPESYQCSEMLASDSECVFPKHYVKASFWFDKFHLNTKRS